MSKPIIPQYYGYRAQCGVFLTTPDQDAMNRHLAIALTHGAYYGKFIPSEEGRRLYRKLFPSKATK